VKALKGVGGTSQNQVPKQVDPAEHSVPVAPIAYLPLLKLRAQGTPSALPWSTYRLQRPLACQVVEARHERSTYQMAQE
jgi:hypothetical protein